MPVRKIITLGNPILRQKAQPVSKITKSEQRLIDDLFETMEEYQGVGLAAPQIAVPKRIFVACWEDEAFAIINPVVEWRSKEMIKDMEGCLSVPGVQAKVNRHLKIRVRGLDRNGKLFILEPEGWLARIFQHEIDHLDGILIIDRSDELFWVKRELNKDGKEKTLFIPATRSEITEAFQRHKGIVRI